MFNKERPNEAEIARHLYRELAKKTTPENEELRHAIEKRYPDLTSERERIAEGLSYLVDFWEKNGNKTINGLPLEKFRQRLSITITPDETNALSAEIESCADEERKGRLASLLNKLV